MIMQIHMQAELQDGMKKMKYCLNHRWKFDRPYFAWLAGFCQTIATGFVVIVNYLAILTQTSITDIVMNFLALVVISEIDDYFF